jgi:hypothetical protein
MQDEKPVIDFLRTESGTSPKKRIDANTKIGRDLGVDGDDAEELLQAFSKKFNVNINQFPFRDYFGPETAFNPVFFLWHIFFGKKLKELTVNDLVKAAENGTLK